MRRLTMCTMMAAAGLTAVAGSASAQNLKAEIPFSFRVRGALMPAGQYQVKVESTSAGSMLLFRNTDARRAILVQYSLADAPKAWAEKNAATLQFECAGGHCEVRGLYIGQGRSAFQIPGPAFKYGESQLTELRMTPIKSE